jgi:predicted AlkP superfamily phosphohydrolase/phosphomutase
VREAHEMTKQHFALFRHLLRTHAWDFAMMVEIGVDRIHHGFWQYFDETHHRYQPGNPYQDVILDYYRLVDREVGLTLSELDGETAVLVYSDHGARKMVGGVCINEWLIREGHLTLRTTPASPTRLSMDDVDWPRTKAWGEGGYYGRVFINVRGREP